MTKQLAPLYVVPTPLGNLKDISERAREILCTVPWVAAEDTRHTGPFLKQLGSSARLLAAHEHNELGAAEQILKHLEAGEAVALVSDAGTPAISDPGARIVARVRDEGGKIIPLPGPCAAVTALSASGLEGDHWLFYGFLPPKSGQRQKALNTVKELPYLLVFYEAPHRILDTLADLKLVLGGDRTLVIARELTKLFETIQSMPLADAAAWVEADANQQKGEFVLLVSGAVAGQNNLEAERVLRLLLAEKLPVRQAASLTAAITGASKNALYEQALALKE